MLRDPKAKKPNKIKKGHPLPLFENKGDELIKFKGNFNDFCISIEQVDAMKMYYNGYFGKANLSRGFPHFPQNSEKVNIIRNRQLKIRNDWIKKYTKNSNQFKVLVTPDSDSETDIEDYFTNLKAEYGIESNILKENLNLNLEEAIFLSSTLKCLDIFRNGKLLNSNELWNLFVETDKFFIQNYITYYYFRSKNWVVKPGNKFGGDFLLYKDGPPFYHASYLVIIDVISQETLERKEEMCKRPMETTSIICLNRLCETAGKELLICQIIWPKDVTVNGPEDISKVNVKTILVNRWILPQDKDIKEDE